MVLIRRFPSLCITALWLMLSAQAMAAVVAEVDRRSIGFGETLQLVVRSDQQTSDSPDTSVLAADFDVLSSSQSTRRSIINGRSEISSEWLYTLAPKREGRVLIPAIRLGPDSTQPISVEVGPASQASSDAAVFLKSELDRPQVYVQQQAILTLRVYHAVALGRGANLSEPSIPDAIVKKLTDNEFQTRIDGREYRVFEQKFAIFPQRSGVLEIPPSVLTATIPTRRSSRNLLDPFANNGQTIRLMSEALQIEVRPQDDRYRGEHWLPANNLMILDDWNGGDTTLALGDSATRTITVIADGLLGAQIPPLPVPDIPGLKFYPDQAVVSDGEGDKIVGSFTQSYAIIATQAGTYTLPEQRIEWWDSQAMQTRSATLPAQTLTILAMGQSTAPTPSKTPTLAPPQVEEPAAPSVIEQSGENPAHDHSAWWWAIGVLTALWLASSAIAWTLWRRAPQLAATTSLQSPTTDSGEKAIYQACKNKDAAATLGALRHWAMLRSGQRDLDAALNSIGDDKLLLQASLLQRALFHPAGASDTNNAFATIETRVKHLHSRKKAATKASLAPLYPRN